MGGEGALGGVEGTVADLLASVPGTNIVIRGKRMKRLTPNFR